MVASCRANVPRPASEAGVPERVASRAGPAGSKPGPGSVPVPR